MISTVVEKLGELNVVLPRILQLLETLLSYVENSDSGHGRWLQMRVYVLT